MHMHAPRPWQPKDRPRAHAATSPWQSMALAGVRAPAPPGWQRCRPPRSARSPARRPQSPRRGTRRVRGGSPRPACARAPHHCCCQRCRQPAVLRPDNVKQRSCTPQPPGHAHDACTLWGQLATSAHANGPCMHDAALRASRRPCAAAPSARRAPRLPAPHSKWAHAAAPSPCRRAHMCCRKLRLKAYPAFFKLALLSLWRPATGRGRVLCALRKSFFVSLSGHRQFCCR